MFFHLKISGLVFPTNILMCTSIFEPDRERWYPMLNCPRTRVFIFITSSHSLSTQIAFYFAPRFLLPPRVCSPVTEWYIRTKKITGISESRSLMCVVTKCKASYLQNGTKWSQWCSASVALWHSVINHTTLSKQYCCHLCRVSENFSSAWTWTGAEHCLYLVYDKKKKLFVP